MVLYTIITIIPMILIIGIWLFFMRQVQGGSNKAMSFGKIRIRMLEKSENPITFKNVEEKTVVVAARRAGNWAGVKRPNVFVKLASCN